MSRAPDNADAPWYRHMWVWLVMIPPAAAVIGGFFTAWLAGGPPALVVDDYSEIAMATEQRQHRDHLARELGLAATLGVPASAGSPATVALEIRALDTGFEVPDQLRLQFIHPMREELDREITLKRIANGRYSGSFNRPTGRYYVQLEDLEGAWRLVGELPDGATTLQLAAQRAP